MPAPHARPAGKSTANHRASAGLVMNNGRVYFLLSFRILQFLKTTLQSNL